MESGLSVGSVGAVALLVALLVVLLGMLAFLARQGRRTRQELAASNTEISSLHARVAALSQEVETTRGTPGGGPAVGDADPMTEYVITSAGVSTGSTAGGEVPTRVVLSATLGEPLVKAMAFGYGVRRALAPATRNRIAFEIRQETKRARKQRRLARKRSQKQTQQRARQRTQRETARQGSTPHRGGMTSRERSLGSCMPREAG